jgi:lysophospholipase L1-like esterase
VTRGRTAPRLVLAAVACAACSPSPGPSSDGSGGSGGAPAAGGSSATGGLPIVSGGTTSSGGSFATGGQSSTGGTAAGGSPSSGGASGGSPSGGTGPLLDVTIFIAGDSTVSNYQDTAAPDDMAGWGQMLPEIFSDQVTVDNRAAGGRTALWFHLEGAAPGILEDAQPGDYFFVQFGTNDSNSTATFEVDGTTYPRYADPDTDFKTQLFDYYIEPARAASVIPVLVTPPPRNSAYCGNGNSLAAHSQAMRELGETENVTVLDLNTKTFDHLAAICPSPTPEDFFAFRNDGTVDGTHFQEGGARHMAGFLGQCIQEVELGLGPYLLP